jgi:hypothetical protein
MRRQPGRMLLSLGALVIAIAASGYMAKRDSMCELGCTTGNCPPNMQALCEQHCGTCAYMCGSAYWCEPEETAYHCGEIQT